MISYIGFVYLSKTLWIFFKILELSSMSLSYCYYQSSWQKFTFAAVMIPWIRSVLGQCLVMKKWELDTIREMNLITVRHLVIVLVFRCTVKESPLFCERTTFSVPVDPTLELSSSTRMRQSYPSSWIIAMLCALRSFQATSYVTCTGLSARIKYTTLRSSCIGPKQ